MFKLFVVAATLSVAFGAAIDDAIKAFEAGDSKIDAITDNLEQISTDSVSTQAQIEKIVSMYTTGLDVSVMRTADVQGQVVSAEMGAQGSVQDSTSAAITAAHSKTYNALIELDNLLDTIDDMVVTTVATEGAKAAKDMEATVTSLKTIQDNTDELQSRLDAIKACNDKGEIYDAAKKSCKGVLVSPENALPKVYHFGSRAEDGRDHGWINNRQLKCTKKFDDTYLRIFVHENMRVHGHTAHGRWHIMFCDGGGNNCERCSNPGQLYNWRWSQHQHNWWMNDHWSNSVSGVCKKAGNRELTKGDHTIKMFLDSNRYDIHTGHNQYNSIQCDEVMVQ